MTTTVFTETETWLDGGAGRLFVRHWPATVTPIATLVICPGFNAHSGHYDRAARVFAERGIAVTAIDLRGRGKSDGERYFVAGFDDYVADLSLAIDHARAAAPGLPLHLLGHSAGGVTAVLHALDGRQPIDGLICESFALRSFAPDLALTLLRGASHVAPHAHVLRLKMEDFSRDPAWVEQLHADPLVADEVQPIQTVAALARAGETIEGAFAQVALPVLILHGTADKATRPDGSQAFFDGASSADKTLRLYEGYYHDPLNDLGRDRVSNDIGNWIVQRAR